MRYFVTGATGFLGGHLVERLLAEGHEVVALARQPSLARDLARDGITLYKGDVTDKETLRAPMEGTDGVFHLAGWYKVGVRDPSPAEAVNVLGTRNVLGVMEEQGIPRGVYTSTLAVFSDTGGELVDETYRYDGPHLTEYDRTKWKAHYEEALPRMGAGLPLTIVMPGVIYGPGARGPVRPYLVQYLEGKLKRLPAEAAVCWGHVEDTARAHVLAMERGEPGETYIIAGPPHTYGEAFEIAEEITGIPAPPKRASPATLRFLARLMEGVNALVPLSGTYHPETLRAMAGVTYLGSNAKAREELGFDPRPLKVGLRPTLAHEMRLLGMEPPEG